MTRPHSDRFTHYVYRVFDARDRLLYVGCTRDVNARLAVHRAWGNPSDASFHIKLYGVRIETVTYPNYAAGRAEERRAIADEAPLFNREHNPKVFRKVGQCWERIGPEPEFPRSMTEDQRSDLLRILAPLSSPT